jgi:uncharacterized protein (DUF1800 family)
MITAEFPLQEKNDITVAQSLVATLQKSKSELLAFQHNQILRKNAFGNFKTLTEIFKSNAMVRYLDNNDNRKGTKRKLESRIELFTLDIGNYSEDIKNGAKD